MHRPQYGIRATYTVWHARHTLIKMSSITERFGQQVRRIRRAKNMSQLELSEKSKLDLTTINEIENGNREPMLRTVWKIANALDVKLPELFDF